MFLWYKKYRINNLIKWKIFVGAARSGTAPTNAFVGAASSGTAPTNRPMYTSTGARGRNFLSVGYSLLPPDAIRLAIFSSTPRRHRLLDLSRHLRPLSTPPPDLSRRSGLDPRPLPFSSSSPARLPTTADALAAATRPAAVLGVRVGYGAQLRALHSCGLPGSSHCGLRPRAQSGGLRCQPARARERAWGAAAADGLQPLPPHLEPAAPRPR